MLKHEEKKLCYRLMFGIKTYEYLVVENKVDSLCTYLKQHGIENDGGYLFGDCFIFAIRTNSIHDKIIRKEFAFA